MNKKKIKNKIKEAKEQITELQETINNLEEQLNKTEGRWIPERNEQYYYIDSDGEAIRSYNDDGTYYKNIISIGNCFKTKEEAEFEVERLKVIAELKEFAFEPNWEDRNQNNYTITYSHSMNEIGYCISHWIQRDSIYFETKEIMEKAIEKVGENRIKKYIFGVEE